MKSWLLVLYYEFCWKCQLSFIFEMFNFHAKIVKAVSLLKDKHNQPSSHST